MKLLLIAASLLSLPMVSLAQSSDIEGQIGIACTHSQSGFKELKKKRSIFSPATAADALDDQVISAFNEVLKKHPEIVDSNDPNNSTKCTSLLRTELKKRNQYD